MSQRSRRSLRSTGVPLENYHYEQISDLLQMPGTSTQRLSQNAVRPQMRTPLRRRGDDSEIERVSRNARQTPSQRLSQNPRDRRIVLQANGSQSDVSIPDEQIDAWAGALIRYLLIVDRTKTVITADKIKKNAIPEHQRHFRTIIARARTKLREIFGYILEDLGGQKYILVNEIPNTHLQFPGSDRAEMVLLFLALAHIFMSGNNCSEEDLFSFLVHLGIHSDDNAAHPYFGDIGYLISEKFVNQLYLLKSKDSNTEPPIIQYSWGVRADKELDLNDVLKFVAEVHNRPVDSWPVQHRTAENRRGNVQENID